jgi:pimeloyl-ACP methyl ester carboxylesterase
MALFMKTVGLPEEMIAGMRTAPVWGDMEAIAHTLAYDAAVMGDSMVPTALASSLTVPTLVLNGSETGAWATNAAEALAATLPDARRQTLNGQTHNVSWDVLAPALIDFFKS